MSGPHVFGDGRIGCWFTPSTNFSDKLRDRVSKIRALGMTDAFLPRQAAISDKDLVRQAGSFVALYETPPHGMNAKDYAAQTIADVNRLAVGVVELNIEGLLDDKIGTFVRDTWSEIRKVKPNLRLRINVVPFKGQFLPATLFVDDAQLYVIVQNYFGNMDARVAEDEIVRDLVDYGIPKQKVSVMYGAHIGQPRVRSLPVIRFRGSFYNDDLLADAGYI